MTSSAVRPEVRTTAPMIVSAWSARAQAGFHVNPLRVFEGGLSNELPGV
jgi:hypothetical protein